MIGPRLEPIVVHARLGPRGEGSSLHYPNRVRPRVRNAMAETLPYLVGGLVLVVVVVGLWIGIRNRRRRD
jgi:hypothetical protein